MTTVVEGFAFSDFCQRCRKVVGHKVEVDGKDLFGVCRSCSERRQLTEANEVYYPRTDLWVTRFKVGNLPNVVAGRLLVAVRRLNRTS